MGAARSAAVHWAALLALAGVYYLGSGLYPAAVGPPVPAVSGPVAPEVAGFEPRFPDSDGPGKRPTAATPAQGGCAALEALAAAHSERCRGLPSGGSQAAGPRRKRKRKEGEPPATASFTLLGNTADPADPTSHRCVHGARHTFYLADQQCRDGESLEVQVEAPTVKLRPNTEDLRHGLYRVSALLGDAETYTFSAWHCRRASKEEVGKVPLCDGLLLRWTVKVDADSFPSATPRCRHLSIQNFSGGRWRVLPRDSHGRPFCAAPYCSGDPAGIQGDGWVYVPHGCHYHFPSLDEAWRCAAGRWLLVWGDSTMQDTVRNLVEGLLGVRNWLAVSASEVKYNAVYRLLPLHERTMDRTFVRDGPWHENNGSGLGWGRGGGDPSSARVSMVWNGHWDPLGKYLGLATYRNASYVRSISRAFDGGQPDLVVIHSGMHDLRSTFTDEEILANLHHAANVWRDLKHRSGVPFVWRTAGAWAGDLRPPQLNARLLRVTRQQRRVLADGRAFDGLLPFLDMSWPWHWDYGCSDGMHYGLTGMRKELNMKKFGHAAEYKTFVDRMLGVAILHSLCPGAW